MSKQDADYFFDLEYFFELSPDLLCIAGFDGYFKKINPAVSKTLGYTPEELMAKPINSFVHPQDQKLTASKRDLIRKSVPLLHFDNRYITKKGDVVWLTWTSMPIESEQVVFAIAKNITYRKKLEEYHRISALLSPHDKKENSGGADLIYSPADQAWLSEFEMLVRKLTGKIDLNIRRLSNELAMSERQLFRRIKHIMGITPNQYVRAIRLRMAMEAIEHGKCRTVSEIAYIAGFDTPAYFSKIFKEVYGVEVTTLI